MMRRMEGCEVQTKEEYIIMEHDVSSTLVAYLISKAGNLFEACDDNIR